MKENQISENQGNTWNLDSIAELSQDYFFVIIMLEILKKMKNNEAINYLSLFLMQILPVLIDETSITLSDKDYLNKRNFYPKGMKNKVYHERQHVLKRLIVKSERSIPAINAMGINFEEKIYDINIKISGNCLQDINYESYISEPYSSEYLDFVRSTPYDVFYAIAKGVSESLEINDLLNSMEPEINDIAKRLDVELTGTRYSYSTYKLFFKSSNLCEKDKELILYRYRMLTSVMRIEKVFPAFSLKINNKYEFKHQNFFMKWKAVAIDVLMREFTALDSPFSNDIMGRIKDFDFFEEFEENNRSVRNNLHYSKTTPFDSATIESLQSQQNKILTLIKNSFDRELNIDIDKECITITNLCLEADKKGIPLEEFKNNYYFYYLKFKILKHL